MLTIDANTMIQQLHAFCAIHSGSQDLTGLAAMHDALYKDFTPLSYTIQSIALPDVLTIAMTGEEVSRKSGNALCIRKRPHLKRRVLLSGHMDTVYGPDHPFQTLQQLDNNTLNGPGVADMKGGLVVMLHALQAFEQTEHAAQLGWDVFINTDEELGSAASSPLMMDVAQHCQAALIYEPAMTSTGVLAKNRKGNIKITLVATGRAAHAGRDFQAGRNAICYLAEIISAIHALNGQRAGVTLNVGIVAGGTALNVIPDKAVVKVDVRITLPEDALWLDTQLIAIETHYQKKDFALHIHTAFDRPPKRINPGTLQLFSRLCAVGQSLQLNLEWEDCGGCCDGNNLAQYGLPVLDSLGVRGGKIHTSDEYILLDSLVERAKLSALLLENLAKS